jgi:hypothetical protein
MLSGAHLHLLINHAPIFGGLFALALLVASYLYAPDVMRRTALVVLMLTAIAGGIAKWSGDPAEDAIRGFPGVKRELIRDHERMADKAFIVGAVLGVLALGALIRWRKTSVPGGVTGFMILATAFAGGAMFYTALLGGRIRHTEVRPDAVKADAMTIEPPRQRRSRPPTQ